MSPAQILPAPFPFPELSVSEASSSVNNRLDEAQGQQMEAAHRAYGIRSANPITEAKVAITRSLGVYVVGPAATTQAEFILFLSWMRSLSKGLAVP
ncbi:hypothetical protein Plhal703r1_c04g0020881 [Plasmopara halstedii]